MGGGVEGIAKDNRGRDDLILSPTPIRLCAYHKDYGISGVGIFSVLHPAATDIDRQDNKMAHQAHLAIPTAAVHRLLSRMPRARASMFPEIILAGRSARAQAIIAQEAIATLQ